MITMKPSPNNLRPDLIRRIESLPEDGLLWVHKVLLHLEKDELWKELSAEMDADHHEGKFARLPDIIREVRGEIKRA
ncbi:MAG: hypothetical protein WCI20_08400 [bacterium]